MEMYFPTFTMKIIIQVAFLLSVVQCQSNQDDPFNKTYKIVTILSEPFTMVDPERPGQFIGFIPDLVQKMSHFLNFKYEISLSVDGHYGSKEMDGTYNGMVGQLTRKEVDMAAAPLTITSQRTRVVDFSQPFMITGIGMLTKDTGESITSWTDLKCIIFSPFRAGVWLLIIVAFLTVSICLHLLNRFHPKEHGTAHRLGKSSQEEAEAFTLAGSSWLILMTFMHQGCRNIPRTFAGRILLACWFAFSILTLVLYTAAMFNLISNPQHSARNQVNQLQSATDVVKSGLKYGYLGQGSTHNFFRVSKVALYETMYMNAIQVASSREAMAKVEAGGFCWVGEWTTLDYMKNNKAEDCDLVQVGNLLDQKGYGIATPLGSPQRDRVDLAILELKEVGAIDQLYQKWFHQNTKCFSDKKKNIESDDFAPIGVQAFTGVIVLLFVGILVAFLVAVVEVFIPKFRGQGRPRDTVAVNAEEGTALKETKSAPNEDKTPPNDTEAK